jgi:hypothetical protein
VEKKRGYSEFRDRCGVAPPAGIENLPIVFSLVAEIGSSQDPNPNPIAPGLFFFTFWPAMVASENGENLVSVHGMNYRLGLGCVTMSPRERNPIPNSLQTDTCRSKRFFVRIIACRVRSGTRPQAGK